METCDLKPFVSQITPSSAQEAKDVGRDVEILKKEVVDYLKQLKAAVCADLVALDERLGALEP
jgi:hypothetical protein